MLNRETIEQVLRHMREPGLLSNGTSVANWYPALAEALAERCEPYPDQAKHGGGKYRPLAVELVELAEYYGFKSPKKDKHQSEETTMEIVERARIDMRRGRGSLLAGAMIGWLWQKDEAYTRRFFKIIGFSLAATEVALLSEEMGSSEYIGIASRSQYTIIGQLHSTRSRIILIAQNHWHLVSTEERHGNRYWPHMLAALKRGIDIDIVAMHPDVGPRGKVKGDRPPSAIDVWAQFMNTPEFPEQIEICWQRLCDWSAEYESLLAEQGPSEKLGAFRAFGAYFTPTTITIIDPEGLDGMIVVSPRTSEHKSASRPQFAIHKSDNPEGFTHYWSYVENALSDHHWMKIL